MINPKKLNKLRVRSTSRCRKGSATLVTMWKKKIRQTLQSQLTRLDLVSREEFDVQTQVLLRTREKLALLEQRLSELEKRGAEPAAVTPAPAIPPVDTQE